jgi:hypothetical protein
MRDFFSVGWTDRGILQKRSGLIARYIGIIDGIHNAICPHDLEGEQERGKRKHPAGSCIHLLDEVVRDRPLQLFGDRG